MAVGAAMGRKTDLRLIHRLPLCVPETERMEALSLPEGGNTIMNDLDELNFTPLPPVTDLDWLQCIRQSDEGRMT